jgi:hypothetical protein
METIEITEKEIHNLRARWNKVIRGNSDGWENFDQFLAWCMENGYRQGAEIRRKNTGNPHSPRNTYFYNSKDRTGFCAGCRQKCPTAGKGCEAWNAKFIKYWNESIHYSPKPKAKEAVEEIPKKPVRETFKYYHPDEIRRILANG